VEAPISGSTFPIGILLSDARLGLFQTRARDTKAARVVLVVVWSQVQLVQRRRRETYRLVFLHDKLRPLHEYRQEIWDSSNEFSRSEARRARRRRGQKSPTTSKSTRWAVAPRLHPTRIQKLPSTFFFARLLHGMLLSQKWIARLSLPSVSTPLAKSRYSRGSSKLTTF